MRNLKFDFFKISIVIILLGFLFVFYQFSENGRFYSPSDGAKIIDSRTGAIYTFYDNKSRGGNAKLISNPLPK
jgi:hypothetical protein